MSKAQASLVGGGLLIIVGVVVLLPALDALDVVDRCEGGQCQILNSEGETVDPADARASANFRRAIAVALVGLGAISVAGGVFTLVEERRAPVEAEVVEHEPARRLPDGSIFACALCAGPCDPAALFCSRCGGKLAAPGSCPKCAQPAKLTDVFCASCGFQFVRGSH